MPTRAAGVSWRAARGGGALFLAALGAIAAALFLGLAGYMRAMDSQARSGARIREQLTASGAPRPLADVARAVQQMKLVTVEVDSRVTAETGGESWRGDAAAKVEAPVKLLYGTDLSAMSVHSMTLSPVDGGLLVRIPRPERIATEVCGDAESVEVTVGWLRFRSRAGEYYLGLARRELYRRAKELALSPADARFVNDTTRKQAEGLVRKIVGEGRPVAVVYEDGGP